MRAKMHLAAGPAAGAVCVRLPEKKKKSVGARNPRAAKTRKGGLLAGGVCVRLPAKSMESVFVRKPRSRKRRKGGPAAFSYSAKIRRISSTIFTILSIPSTVRCSYGPWKA